MDKMFQINVSTEEDNDQIYENLRLYNRQYMSNFKDYNYHISENGKIVAGVVAGSVMDTLEVDYLFVDPNHRGSGLGSKLLNHVETLAKQDGLKRILLFTYSFQAPEFYKAHGYKEVFEMNPCFGEYSQHFYCKEIV